MPRFVQPLTATTDNYQYFSCPKSTFVTVQVFNNGVDIGYGDTGGRGSGLGSAMYPPVDEYLALQTATLPRLCDEIRFRSHVKGTPAQIQITAQGSADLPSDLPLSVGISDNFITINPNGTVGANFTGLINALGLILPAGTGAVSQAQNTVTWNRTTDNVPIATLYAFDQPPGSGDQDQIGITSYGGGRTTQEVGLTATAASPRQAYFVVEGQNGSDPNTRVYAGAVNGSSVVQSATIIDAAGNSDFIQTMGGLRNWIITPLSNTATGAIPSGGDVSITAAIPGNPFSVMGFNAWMMLGQLTNGGARYISWAVTQWLTSTNQVTIEFHNFYGAALGSF